MFSCSKKTTQPEMVTAAGFTGAEGGRKLVRHLCALVGSILLAVASFGVQAAIISFSVTPLGGQNFRYDYVVENPSGAANTIDEFTIYFDHGSFSNLMVAASPAGWDSIVAEPDTTILADGFFDSLALGAGLAPGDPPLSGFAVTFTFTGSGLPGPQRFEIVDPVDFSVLASGFTVSEPGILPLVIGAGVLAAAARRRRRA